MWSLVGFPQHVRCECRVRCLLLSFFFFSFFFFNVTSTTEIYTLSLHDALPICSDGGLLVTLLEMAFAGHCGLRIDLPEGDLIGQLRSEEHTSELQSQSTISYAVFCLTKKKKKQNIKNTKKKTPGKQRPPDHILHTSKQNPP